MCEFKIIKKNDASQIGEDILLLTYTENNELVFRDVLGAGEKIDSALILEVNTLNQTVTILEHPLIKDFLGLMNNIKKLEIENFQSKLEDLKNAL